MRIAKWDGSAWSELAGSHPLDFRPAVYELAVCIAYAMLGKDDPLAAAAHVVDGYHEVFPLLDVEPELLFHLACMRLCTSVAMAAHQRKLEPDNEYLSISEERDSGRLLRACYEQLRARAKDETVADTTQAEDLRFLKERTQEVSAALEKVRREVSELRS